MSGGDEGVDAAKSDIPTGVGKGGMEGERFLEKFNGSARCFLAELFGNYGGLESGSTGVGDAEVAALALETPGTG